MLTFKYSFFGYEDGNLEESQRILHDIVSKLGSYSPSAEIFQLTANSLEAVAQKTDEFKSQTCGSGFNIAIINLNGIPQKEELGLLLQPQIVGNPWTIFLVTLKGMKGDLYSLAKEKVEREANSLESSGNFQPPSCIECYSPLNKDQAVIHVCEMINAYREELDLKDKNKKSSETHIVNQFNSPVMQTYHKSRTTFFGRKLTASSTRIRALRADDSA